MKLYLERRGAGSIDVSVEEECSVQQIKDKIRDVYGIPQYEQTLIHGGRILNDDATVDVFTLEAEESRIELVVASDDHPAAKRQRKESPPPSPVVLLPTPKPGSARVLVRMPRFANIGVEMKRSDTVLALKRKIHEADPAPVERLVLRFGGIEMSDEKTLGEYGISDMASVVADFAGSGEAMEVVVVYGGVRTPVVVKELETVQDLRRKLDLMGVAHPPKYFCILDDKKEKEKSFMDDHKTFRWHRVAHGDEIELFPGFIGD